MNAPRPVGVGLPPVTPVTPRDRGWMARGVCATADPRSLPFYDRVLHGHDLTNADTLEAAANVCGPCPVRAECAGYAIAHDMKASIWGGMTPAERAAFTTPAKVIDLPDDHDGHGTPAGWDSGCRCSPCTRAKRRARVEAGEAAVPHGTPAGAKAWSCGCDQCREAVKREAVALQRRLRGTEPPQHGTRWAYEAYGCLCDACKAAKAASRRRAS
jgi:hypothetical protein